MLETINYLERLLKPGDSVVIGLSGGKDSMCLLDLLMKLNKKITIIAAHINHNIREESNEEAKIIEKYCKEKNVIFETIKFPKKSNTSKKGFTVTYGIYCNSLKFAKQPVTIISESADEFSCTSAIVLIERIFFPNAQVIIIIISAIV